MNCPICDKAGLPENITSCPQCNSDLSGFLIIKEVAQYQQRIEDDNVKAKYTLIKSKTKIRIILIFCGIILISSIIATIWSGIDKKATIKSISESYILENDSLNYLVNTNKEQIGKLESENQALKKDQRTVKYIVRSGDNLTKIALYFYGQSSQYVEIMKDNNLQENEVLYPGDILNIKLKN